MCLRICPTVGQTKLIFHDYIPGFFPSTELDSKPRKGFCRKIKEIQFKEITCTTLKLKREGGARWVVDKKYKDDTFKVLS